ncbi:MAG TPA: cupredoxin domain-containing protein [Nitrococcus sp.]|nr:cupredoxin domain-containing protein [Nitrococcus sp.]
MRPISIVFAATLVCGVCLPAMAQDTKHVLVISNHRFSPQTLSVPAGQRLQLVVENRDATVEEFESHDLRREKLIPGNSKATVWVGPLPKGEYGFYGEFHPDTAQGKLIAR